MISLPKDIDSSCVGSL